MSNKLVIFKNISWQVISETVFKLLGLVFFLLFTRKLGQTVLGFYTYVFAVLALVNMLWDLGINSFYTRKWVSDDSEYKKDLAVIGSAHVVTIVLSLLFLVPYIFLVEKRIWVEFVLGTLIYAVDLFKAIPSIYFISKNRFDRVFVINMLDRGFGYILAIAALFAGFNLKAVLLCLLIGKICGLVYGNILKPSFVVWPFVWKDFAGLLKMSLPLFLVGLFGSLYFRIDSVLIKYFLGFNELGIYSAAYRLIDTGTIVSSILSSSTFQVLVSVQAQATEVITSLLSKSLKYLSLLAGFMVVCGVLKAAEVSLFLFGDQFIASGPVLQFLAPSLFFLFCNGLFIIQMLASHQEKYLLKSMVFLALFNILLNLYCIPRFGLIGAAVTTFISEVLSAIILYQRLPGNLSYVWLPGLIASLMFAGLVLYALPVHWVAGVAISACVYALSLFVLKVIVIDDIPFSAIRSKLLQLRRSV